MQQSLNANFSRSHLLHLSSFLLAIFSAWGSSRVHQYTGIPGCAESVLSNFHSKPGSRSLPSLEILSLRPLRITQASHCIYPVISCASSRVGSGSQLYRANCLALSIDRWTYSLRQSHCRWPRHILRRTRNELKTRQSCWSQKSSPMIGVWTSYLHRCRQARSEYLVLAGTADENGGIGAEMAVRDSEILHLISGLNKTYSLGKKRRQISSSSYIPSRSNPYILWTAREDQAKPVS